MSYCRWSSDNWTSDVYAYESAEGYVVHVAFHRRVGVIPPLPDIRTTTPEEFLKIYNNHLEAVDRAALVPIGGEHDGETLVFSDLEEFEDGLRDLVAKGYHVPASVFEMIREERGE